MIREFIQCKDTRARLQLLSQTKESDWSEGELETIMTILGIADVSLSKDEKWSRILCKLIDMTYHEQEELKKGVFKDTKEEEKVFWKGLQDLEDFQALLKIYSVA